MQDDIAVSSEMSSFTFKHFVVKQDRCAMKVGTDGVILGAWAVAKEGKILDVGTGTGLIALILAQRTKTAEILGVEIDQSAAQQAQENVHSSLWNDRISIINKDVFSLDTSLFFDDYSKVRLGDYYYEDGTLSHEIALGKKMVGMVFNLNTSDEEKKNGWTHGQIIALEDAKVLKKDCMSWGIVNNSILKLAVKNPGGIVNGKDTGYLISHLECVENNPDFKPFIIASQYDVQLPTGETSGWYLPCIAQWRTIYENFHSQWQKYWRFLKITGRGGITVYATSSVYDRDNAWKYAMGYAEDYLDHAYQKESLKADWGTVRAVAAF